MNQVARAALTFLVAVVFVVGASLLVGPYVRNTRALSAAIAAGIFIIYLAGSRWIERRPPPEVDDRRGASDLVYGILLGVALFSAVMGVLWLAGDYRPTGRGSTAGVAASAISALVAAVGEETLFRGLLYRLVSQLAGTWIAIAATSALFGLGHAFNPGATVVSSLAIALEAGVLLAAAYVVTGRLWLPIGIHAGWNFTEGAVYGMSVSGGRRLPGLIAGTLQGPVLLTGGSFGPEASVVAVIVCLTVAVMMLRRAMKRRLVQQPIWSRANG